MVFSEKIYRLHKEEAARASFGKRGENRWIFLVFSEKIYRLHKEEPGFCMGKISVFYRKA